MRFKFLPLLALLWASVCPAASKNIFISRAEIMALPIDVTPYTEMKAYAQSTWATWSMSNQEPNEKGKILAGALVYLREDDTAMRNKVANELMKIKRSWDTPAERTSATTLAVVRNITHIVLAADVIDFTSFGHPDSVLLFDAWLDTVMTAWYPGSNPTWPTIDATHENAGHNWSAWAGPARLVLNLYRGNTAIVARCDSLFRALGDRSFYPTYSKWVSPQGYYEPRALMQGCWSCDTTAGNWIEINPPCYSALYPTVNIDGAPTDDMGRPPGCGGWPPTFGDGNQGTYSWESVEAHVITAEFLYRAGYTNAFKYNNNMVLRELQFMQRATGFYDGSGGTQDHYAKFARPSIFIANYRYGTNFPTEDLVGSTEANQCISRASSFNDWTHARPVCCE